MTTNTDRGMLRGRAISILEKIDKVGHNNMTQITCLLAEATVFITLWALISTFYSRGGGLYTRQNYRILSNNSRHLQLSNSVKHLGYILQSNLSEDEDIARVRKDLTRKANCMLHSFSCCNPCVKIKLFSSFCCLCMDPVYGLLLPLH